MYPKVHKTDRVELWNLIYGNLKSHLSNKRSASTLFHSNYTASDSFPVLNFYRPNDEVKDNFIEVCPTKITLQLLATDGKIVDQKLKLLTKVFLRDGPPEQGKIDLTKFRIKKKNNALGSFIQIHGFKLKLARSVDLKEFKLKKLLRYYLPNEKNGSPLVDPASIILMVDIRNYTSRNGKVKLRIPVAEKRIFQAKKDLDRYVYY